MNYRTALVLSGLIGALPALSNAKDNSQYVQSILVDPIMVYSTPDGPVSLEPRARFKLPALILEEISSHVRIRQDNRDIWFRKLQVRYSRPAGDKKNNDSRPDDPKLDWAGGKGIGGQ